MLKMGDLRVLVLEPEENLRHCLGQLLNCTEGFNCVGFLADTRQLETDAKLKSAHILLLDLKAAVAMGVEKLSEFKTTIPELLIVLMGMEDGLHYKELAKNAGADTFLSTLRAPEELESLRSLYFQLKKPVI